MSKKIIYPDTYPWNLLLAIKGRTTLSLPSPSCQYSSDGLTYVLSSLSETEQALIRLRYVHNQSQAQAAQTLSISENALREMERNIIRKLRGTARWGYIRWGIAGYMRKRIQEEYQRGYRLGYCTGYRKGLEEPPATPDADILDLPLETLGLSPRALNCLKVKGYQSIRDIVELKEPQIFCIRNLGKKCGQEIGEKLHVFGIYYTDWDLFMTPK